MKKISVLIIAMTLFVSGCSVTSNIDSKASKDRDWELLTESAKNTSVRVYYDIEDEEFLTWMEKSISANLKASHNMDIELKYKPFEEYYEDLKKEYDEENMGKFDVLIYDDSSIIKLIEGNLLYEDFSSKLPNSKNMQSVEDYENIYNEGLDTSKNNILLGREQLVMVYDEDLFDDAPKTPLEMLEITKEMKGKVSYVDPSNQLGRDFINSIFFSFMDYEEIYSMDLSKEELEEKATEGIDYLNSLKPYLALVDGRLPKDQDEIDEMFYNSTIIFSMTHDITHASTLSKRELYPFGAKSFVFESGTTGDAFYGTIPFNSTNKSGAIVVLNEMLSPEAQKYKYDPRKWGNLPSVDTSIMEGEEAKIVNSINLKRSDIKQDELLAYRIPEVPEKISNMLYEIWKEQVEINIYK